ncbi:MAG TPA: amidohydrolase [Thermoanaerobaculia bacterium]|nr:amidohydrolase [Thermoanaerobaculia bacterium]
MRRSFLVLALLSGTLAPISTQAAEPLGAALDRLAREVEPKVVAWRRDFHQHPELSNREARTAKIVADHLSALGWDVRTGVAHHGVVAVLVGGKPGPVVALRADMDALPVTEEVDLPFASKVKAEHGGQSVGVMHACGHDAHTAILMGVAEVLARVKAELPGTVKLIFQPAEEGPPTGEQGGALMMVAEGALDAPRPAAIFGLHVVPMAETGEIAYRAGGQLASSDRLRIVVKGRQAHGGMPWDGIDPVVAAAQIINALQAIPARQVNQLKGPAVVTIGSIHGGVRNNIVPELVEMWGTLRSFDTGTREELHARVKRTAESVAAATGATAEVTIDQGNPVTYNDPELTRRMAPTLARVAGPGKVWETLPVTWAEDFSVYQQQVPGLFVFLGIRRPGQKVEDAAPNHSPRFYVDENALPLGVRTLAHLAVDFLAGEGR